MCISFISHPMHCWPVQQAGDGHCSLLLWWLWVQWKRMTYQCPFDVRMPLSGVEMCSVSEGSVGGGRVWVSGVGGDRVGGCSYRCAVEMWVRGWVWVGVSHRTTNNTKVIGAQAWPSSLIALCSLQTSIIFTVYSFGTVVCHTFTVHETLPTHSTYHTHTHVFGTNGKLCFNMRNANYRSPSVHDSSPLIYSSELL